MENCVTIYGNVTVTIYGDIDVLPYKVTVTIYGSVRETENYIPYLGLVEYRNHMSLCKRLADCLNGAVSKVRNQG